MTSLLLVHGLACDGSDWAPLSHALRQRGAAMATDIVTLDLPGHGQSATPDRATVTELAASVVRGLPSAERVVLVGHSLGCRVILEAAPMLGERLAGVVFMDQNLVTHADLDVAVQTLRTRLDALGVHDFLGIAFTGMFTPDTPASLRERVLRRIPSIDARFARELLLDSLAWEAQVPELLSRLNVPVLLLQSTWLDERFEWRQLEPGMHTPWTRLVCSKVSDCEFQVVPGVGHFLMIEAPEVVAGHLEAFLKRLS